MVKNLGVVNAISAPVRKSRLFNTSARQYDKNGM
jgi:hypothetical protein